jgi:hypothetical protein
MFAVYSVKQDVRPTQLLYAHITPISATPRTALLCAATMPFVKVVKNKAYFKRFQVKYRRRRGECPAHSRLMPA